MPDDDDEEVDDDNDAKSRVSWLLNPADGFLNCWCVGGVDDDDDDARTSRARVSTHRSIVLFADVDDDDDDADELDDTDDIDDEQVVLELTSNVFGQLDVPLFLAAIVVLLLSLELLLLVLLEVFTTLVVWLFRSNV